MKRKSIYLFMLISSLSFISSARQRYSSSVNGCQASVVSVKASDGQARETAKEGFDLSPVGFFVLSM